MIKEINIFKQCVQAASGILSSRGKITIFKKRNKELVTHYDIEINRMVISIIRGEFPGDTIIGEEESLFGPEDNNRFWLIDPIDGTKSFIEGLPGYTFMMSLIVDKEPALSLIHRFIDKSTYLLQKNCGIKILANGTFSGLTVPPEKQRNLIWNRYASVRLRDTLLEAFDLNGIIESEGWGQRSIDYINGKGILFISLPGSSKIWDTAFASLAAEETGGTITDLKGNKLIYNKTAPVNKNGAVCSTAMDHNRLLTTINKYLEKC